MFLRLVAPWGAAADLVGRGDPRRQQAKGAWPWIGPSEGRREGRRDSETPVPGAGTFRRGQRHECRPDVRGGASNPPPADETGPRQLWARSSASR
eukprot:857864-Pyramimonas_sp.AAC.1